jgi:Virulence-associated protein E/Domain of unknown function (DUF3854)
MSDPQSTEVLTSVGRPTATLTPADLDMFAQLRIDPELLARAGIRRVTNQEARQEFGLNGSGDNAGIVFPYVDAKEIRHTCRLRRDRPDFEDGKVVRKYVAPYGDRRHLYIVPGDHALAQDPSVAVVIVEAEKSALALRAWANRVGRQLLPIATGGCWGWRGRIGKVENSRGERVDELGPLPELGICCDGRKVSILLDANCSSNPSVQAARNSLVHQLLKQDADVHVFDLPMIESVNGPDDYIGLCGDDAMARLLDSPPCKAANWRQLMIYRQTKGVPQPERVLTNVLTAFRHAPEWNHVLGFDEFSQQVVTRRTTPWGKAKGSSWSDRDDSLATEWMQKEGGIFVTSTTVAEAVQTVSHERPFHPVRDHLESLVWDRVPRIENWLNTHLGGEDSEFARAVGARWLISAVARIFRPGCQVDCVLLLEGPQGIKKSSALRALVGDEWFTDHIADLGSKDSRVDLRGKWVIEMSELAALRRAEIEKVKAFLTARTDHFRPPYGRRAVDVPRQNVFAASTNDEHPFVDSTGNRRFWPVRCRRIDVDAIRRDRDQLWAEAYHRFKLGEIWWLDTVELNQTAQQEQDERYEPGVWDDIILEWVEDPRPRDDRSNGVTTPVNPWYGSGGGKVTISDILIHAIGKDKDRLTQIDRNQVVRCLTHHGWKLKQERGGLNRGKRFYANVDQ